MILLLLACAGPPCQPTQSAPYADGIPYLGVHGDAGNSDVIACESASSFTPGWTALEGLAMTQPNTFSPDGTVLYATTSNPQPAGCRVHALDARSGEVLWCRTEAPSVVNSAVEVDQDGDLYFTAGDALIALRPDGQERWRLALPHGDPWGLHFTPTGRIATVTSEGVVVLASRDGQVLDTLDIPERWGFVAPEPMELDVDLAALVPPEILADVETIWGPVDQATAKEGFSTFLGAGAFVDNTLGIDAEGDLYIIGGGPDPDTGALVQVRVDGDALSPGWATLTDRGSATSPSIAGDFLVIGDGNSTQALLNPESASGGVKVVDIAACNADLDDEPGEEACGVAYEERVTRQPLPGSPAIASDGTVYFYEIGLDWSADPTDRDVIAFGPDGELWSVALADDLDWTSVITVTDNHLIGTASRVLPSGESLLGVAFPERTDDYLVVLDRRNGEAVFRHPVSDDSAATVTIGPDGALYVGVLGMISILSVDDRPDVGLMRFDPN